MIPSASGRRYWLALHPASRTRRFRLSLLHLQQLIVLLTPCCDRLVAVLLLALPDQSDAGANRCARQRAAGAAEGSTDPRAQGPGPKPRRCALVTLEAETPVSATSAIAADRFLIISHLFRKTDSFHRTTIARHDSCEQDRAAGQGTCNP